MRVLPMALVLVSLAGCGGSSPSSPAAPAASSSSPGATPRPTTTRLVIPTASLPFSPCKLTAAQIGAVVGFGVVKQPQRQPDQCEYDHKDGGNVWFSVDGSPYDNIARDKSDEKFSLGGRYITITDESGFAHEAFTAVKNPGDKSPGVIADAEVYLHPGHLKLRIYYPSGGKEPGRQHALRLAHLMVG